MPAKKSAPAKTPEEPDNAASSGDESEEKSPNKSRDKSKDKLGKSTQESLRALCSDKREMDSSDDNGEQSEEEMESSKENTSPRKKRKLNSGASSNDKNKNKNKPKRKKKSSRRRKDGGKGDLKPGQEILVRKICIYPFLPAVFTRILCISIFFLLPICCAFAGTKYRQSLRTNCV